LRLAVVLVHYHTPELAVAAWRALTADLAGSGHQVEWLLVDNGSDDAGKRVLAELPFARIDPGENLGFAGGVNLGVGSSRAEHILLMNPDVIVLPGCVEALLACLHGGAAAAGPRFYWDAGRRLLLPPPEPRSRRAELLRLLARRGGRWAARARRASRLHCRRHWQARLPLPSYSLSGSLLAVRRDAWERVGPFDAAYRLYFEETDWLLRLRRARLPAYHVPAAEAVHLYSQSAFQEPRARAWFEDSARRFRVRHHGAWFAAALAALAPAALLSPRDTHHRPLDRADGRAGPPPPTAAAAPPLPPQGLPLAKFAAAAAPLWVEVSPNPEGFPAAAEPLPVPPPARWTLPPAIGAGLPAATRLWVRVADAAGRELACYEMLAGGGPAARGTG
jgi:N-acetylglucosaminyl-diphospho-decaprenol L-rhamnosyltransferase